MRKTIQHPLFQPTTGISAMIQDYSKFDPITKAEGGLFDVSDEDTGGMESNIGRTVRFKDPEYPAYEGKHTIVDIQNNYDSELIYRVENSNDDFGKPAHPDDIVFVDDKN